MAAIDLLIKKSLNHVSWFIGSETMQIKARHPKNPTMVILTCFFSFFFHCCEIFNCYNSTVAKSSSNLLLDLITLTVRQVFLVRTLIAILSKLNNCGNINATSVVAIILRLSGDKSKEMWNFVQNHHADNSLTLEHPVFSYIFRAWFSTVRSEMKRRLAISFLLAPHANNSAISASRLVRLFASILHSPNILNPIFGKHGFDCFCFRNFGFDLTFQSV